MSEVKKIVYESDYTGINIEEVAYGTTENFYGKMQEYSLDILTDANIKKVTPRPVVIFIHGGAFRQPLDKRQSDISLVCRNFIKEGYVAVSPDYPIYDCVEDRLADSVTAIQIKPADAIKLVYDFIIENADKYGFDTKRIVLMGSSAGSITAYYTLARHKELSFACFGALWGAPADAPEDVSTYPPVFSVHGTKDLSYVREAPITALYADAHISRTLISLGGSGHSPLNKMDEYVPQLVEFVKFHVDKIK